MTKQALRASAAAIAVAAGVSAAAQEGSDGQLLDAVGNPIAADYEVPRLADGAPDFQGVWSSASLTTMTRSGRGGQTFESLVISEEELEDLNYNSYYNRRLREDNEPTPASEGPGDGVGGGDVKGYNNFWIDPGDSYAEVNGTYRSSWIVEPDDGQVPYSAEGRQLRSARFAAARESDNTGPEIRTLGDRCLISFGSQAGPPLVNAMYNNHYQIVQTPDHVMILTEMNHDARIIRLGGDEAHGPEEVRQWFGDSIGWYEGDSLVVETVNVHPIQERSGAVPLSPEGKVTERFTRTRDNQIVYQYTVEDPNYYSQPWRGEMALNLSEENIYEYACHEGNYAMPGILRGMIETVEGSALGEVEGE
ncbi:MAG: hypothetical protein PVI23_03165 [Maricaulaceae bacterium]|jgi:hypothetical protein